VFRFPLKGTWFVAVGPTPQGAHRWALPEEFALDIVRLGEGTSSHRGAGGRLSDYYAYDQPVLAAADGKVVAATDGVAENIGAIRRPDESLEAYGQRVGEIQAGLIQSGAVAGDNVVIDHGDGEYSVYAHLKPGSLKVKAGQAVKAGEVIGALGSSGNSTEPHLHFQVCDGPDPLSCAGIPINFSGVEIPYADSPRSIQGGDIVVAE
jgi:murein DD-endopeptidase MepM/ murein hydrolase activator NlpD